MDADKTDGEKAWRQLRKNAASNIEQVLQAAPHKAAAVLPPPPITKTIKIRRTRHAGHGWRSRDNLIRDVLLLTPSHARAKAGRPARTYIQQLCIDTGCSPEDLSEAMDNKDGWWERVSDICVDDSTWWWWWWWLVFYSQDRYFFWLSGGRAMPVKISRKRTLIPKICDHILTQLFLFLIQKAIKPQCFYMLTIFSFINRSVLSGNQWEHNKVSELSWWGFLTIWLTYFDFRTILVMKPSNTVAQIDPEFNSCPSN